MKIGDLIMDHDFGMTALVLENIDIGVYRVLYEDGTIDTVESGWGVCSVEVVNESR